MDNPSLRIAALARFGVAHRLPTLVHRPPTLRRVEFGGVGMVFNNNHFFSKKKEEKRCIRRQMPLMPNRFKARKLLSSGVVGGMNNMAKVTTRNSYGFHTYPVAEIA